MIRILSLGAVLALALFLNACNTMEGAGEDISAGGNKITNAASNVKNGN